jgi:hypothetical protein
MTAPLQDVWRAAADRALHGCYVLFAEYLHSVRGEPVGSLQYGASCGRSDAVGAPPGKCGGTAEIERLGRFKWKKMVALTDVLIGMVWTDLTIAEQEEIFLSYTSDSTTRPTADDAIYDCRHGSLLFLHWLIEGWPTSPGAEVGRRLLTRWLTADRNRLCRRLRPPKADHGPQAPAVSTRQFGCGCEHSAMLLDTRSGAATTMYIAGARSRTRKL